MWNQGDKEDPPTYNVNMYLHTYDMYNHYTLRIHDEILTSCNHMHRVSTVYVYVCMHVCMHVHLPRHIRIRYTHTQYTLRTHANRHACAHTRRNAHAHTHFHNIIVITTNTNILTATTTTTTTTAAATATTTNNNPPART